jgi:hypothetical protein
MANNLESVRVLWSSTDEQFFRLAADLFPPAFLRGAGVLLASYDPDAELAVVSVPGRASVAPSATSTVPVAL